MVAGKPLLRPLLITFTVVLLALTSTVLWLSRGPAPEGPGPDAGYTAAPPDAVPVGGHFTLTDQNGKKASDTAFRGRLMLVFFGFTHCPDICPVTLATFAHVMQRLGPDAGQVAPVFITVDPGRDTVARLKEYLANFHPSVTGLTGTPQEIEAVIKAYRAYAGPADPGSGLINHSGFIYLMGREGEYITVFSQDDSEQTIVAELRKHLK